MYPALDVHVVMVRAVNEYVRDAEAYESKYEVKDDAEEGTLALRVVLRLVDVLGQGTMGTEVRLTPVSFVCKLASVAPLGATKGWLTHAEKNPRDEPGVHDGLYPRRIRSS